MKKILFGMICAGLFIAGCADAYRHYLLYDPKMPQPSKPGLLLAQIPAFLEESIVRCNNLKPDNLSDNKPMSCWPTAAIRKVDDKTFNFQAQDSIELMPGPHKIFYVMTPGQDVKTGANLSTVIEEDKVYVIDCSEWWRAENVALPKWLKNGRLNGSLIRVLPTCVNFSDLERVEGAKFGGEGFRLKETK